MLEYVCLATFTYTHEYLILKLEFEQAALRYYFQNETLIGLIPFSSLAFGGIKLMVHPSDRLIAKQIIDSLNDKSSNLRIV
ncbi:DUF2007 domain-containing protein [Christiangramia aquimixticola]|uniref:DUF2007 domain-containing protein n=1 Tax=Christiangramia aquimixticola TaxID=1697558 RepID=UPI003AA7DBCB